MSDELALWRTVLLHGLKDAAQGREAEWLGSRDFRHVCHLADMDPGQVLATFSPGRKYLFKVA